MKIYETKPLKSSLKSLSCKLFTCFLLAMMINGYAQDSCGVHAYFTVVRNSVDYTSYIITNHSSGSNLWYVWDFGDGTTSNNPNPGTHVYSSNATRSITLTLIDTIKSCGSSHKETLKFPCSALFNFSVNGNQVAVHPLTAGDSAEVNFSWNFGDGTTSSSVAPYHYYASTGSYTICLTVTNKVDPSCTETQCWNVVIQEVVPCKAGFTYSQDTSDPRIVYLTNTSAGNNLLYYWNFGDGTTSNSSSPGTHVYTTSSDRIICLTVTDSAQNCSSTYCDTLITSNCSAKFTFYRLHSYVYQFQAAQNLNSKFEWDFGDGTVGYTTVPYVTHTFPDNQFYITRLTVTKNDSSCSNSFSNGIHVNVENCRAAFFIHADSSTTDPSDYILYDMSTGDNLNYHWDFGDGTTSTLKNPTHEYSGNGPYYLILTISNDSCTSIFGDTVIFNGSPGISEGKWKLKVVDGKVISGIKVNPDEKISLQNYPNPFDRSTTINYRIPATTQLELSIYNLLGSRIELIETATKAAGTYNLEWNAQQLPEGIYLLQLKTDKQIITRRIIINN